jgi:hypothetical protein
MSLRTNLTHEATTLLTLARVRGLLMAVLALGLAGTWIELLLLAHYEEPWQLVPLVLIALAMAALAWFVMRPGAASVRTLQIVMALCIVSGAAGTMLHMRGAAEFQLEVDPSLPRWQLFTKVMRAQSPPVLAPGVMIQLGLVGLVALYRHPIHKGDDT